MGEEKNEKEHGKKKIGRGRRRAKREQKEKKKKRERGGRNIAQNENIPHLYSTEAIYSQRLSTQRPSHIR